MKKVLLAAGLLLASNVTVAAGWTNEVSIIELSTEGTSDLIVFKTVGGQVYAPGCLINDWIVTADTDARRDRFYSALLAAMVSGHKVKLWYTDACSSWSMHGTTSVKALP
jgi:hypothetical protein